MAKGKKKNNNKNVDVVEEVNKDDNKNQEKQATEPDTVKQQQNQQKQDVQAQSKNQQIQTKNQNQHTNVNTPQHSHTQSNQTPAPAQQTPNPPPQAPSVAATTQHPQKQIQKAPTPIQTHQQTQQDHIEQVPITLVANKDQETQLVQLQGTAAVELDHNNNLTNQNQNIVQVQTLEQKNHDQQVHQENPVVVQDQPVKIQQKIQTNTHQNKQQNTSSFIQLQENSQELNAQQIQDQKIPSFIPFEQKNQQPQQLKNQEMSKQLIDGLNLVGMAAQEIIFQNPLKHEAIAHGNSAFAGKFDPVAFHISEKIQQEQNIRKKTPPKQKVQTPPKKQQQLQALYNIKQSAQSIDPDPLQLQVPAQDSNKFNILKSYHSQSSQQKNKRKQSQSKKQQQRKSHTKNQQEKSRKSSNVSGRNPTFINPLNEQSTKHIQKQIDYNLVNKKMLEERERQWQKIQQQQLEPKSATHIVKPVQPQVLQNIEPVRPNRPQKLQYTNNLNLISTQKVHQQHNKIKAEVTQQKQKVEQIQKLKKDVTKDNPLKKLAISSLLTAACLGACVLGKADKRITAGASIASFIVSYMVQK